jgi:hypothetical protein
MLWWFGAGAVGVAVIGIVSLVVSVRRARPRIDAENAMLDRYGKLRGDYDG